MNFQLTVNIMIFMVVGLVMLGGLAISYWSNTVELCRLGNEMLLEFDSHKDHFPDTVLHIQHYNEQLEMRCN